MIYTFADCELDTQRHTLRCAGQLRHLRPKAFHMLLYLVVHRDRVIDKQEICEQVWPEQFISDTTVESTLRAVRQAVGDSGKAQRLIQTFYRHGYRFVADVAERGAARPAAVTQAMLGRPMAVLPSPTDSEEQPPAGQEGWPPAALCEGESQPCPGCQEAQSQRGGVCTACGTPHSQACPGCGQAVDPQARGCTACGTGRSGQGAPLEPGAAVPPPATAGTPAVLSVTALAPVGRADVEHRHLTVLCCALVDMTALTTARDLEALHEVVRAYHATCAAVVARFDGYVAQYRGDGLLVYFGFPQAHEDDAQRAVRAGLEIVEVMQHGADQAVPLQVRVGIHTGPVVVGVLGAGAGQAPLALGEVPQVAARLLAQAAPQTVMLSAATWRLVAGWFVGEALPGLAQPVPGYRVLRASEAQSRLEVAGLERLTPLVGRTSELALLQERWAQARDGVGQVVLLSGEAGIGKSRLAETLRAQVASEGSPQLVLRCSPYHTHSPLAPVIEHLRRVARIHPEDAPATKLDKLEQMLGGYRLAPAQVVPLFAALLSVPLLERYAPVPLPPQQHKQQTHAALVAWLLEEAERQPVFVLWEDLHWADPSTLEFLSLWITQAPTMRVLTLLLCRPEFHSLWTTHSHCSQLTLPRFTRPQVEQMLAALVGSTPLPEEVCEEVIARTDGVPLFLEELVKMLRESGRLQAPVDRADRTAPRLPLAIPATLQDALMARLDRLGSARDLAQLGATWGREFTYAQMQALVPLEDATMQQRLAQLVAAEILYQRGVPPQASYRFKHALIQETAYQALVRSTRQAYHRRIAQVVAERFPETAETQPELLAHHYTEAGLPAPALPYWQRAGQRAVERSAHIEAITHLRKGLELLATLPETPERARRELDLLVLLGPELTATRRYTAPEVERVYTRARVLCQQVGEIPHRFSVLRGLWGFYFVWPDLSAAQALAEEIFYLADSLADPARSVVAHYTLGSTLLHRGAFAAARVYLEQGCVLYAALPRRTDPTMSADAGLTCVIGAARALWMLGYPDQALQRSNAALTLARELGHPFSLSLALMWAARFHQFRRETQAVLELIEALLALSAEHGFTMWDPAAMMLRGWALVVQGQHEAGMGHIGHVLAMTHALEWFHLMRTYQLTLLAEVYSTVGQVKEGQRLVHDALRAVDQQDMRLCEVELYRLKGELFLQSGVQVPGSRVFIPPLEEAEMSFQQALAIARRQQAKSWELRAAVSLSRLWQHQGQRAAAHQLLAEVYGWFTEGFDTVDLQEARVLLEALS